MNKIKPLEVSSEAIASAMANFENTDTYAMVHGLWHREREQILERGKNAPDAGVLHELRGFDRAASLIRRWAVKLEKKNGAETPNPLEEN